MKESLLRLQLAQTKEYLDIRDVSLITGFSLSTLHRRVKDAKRHSNLPNKLQPIQKAPHYNLLFKKEVVRNWIDNGAK